MLEQRQWRELLRLNSLLYASAIGLTAGMTATMFYSLGAFIAPLQAEFGWSRGDISLGATFLTLAVFCTGTLAGRLCDYFGAALVGAASLVAYALAVIAMVSLMTELRHFWIAYFLIAIFGVGSTPIVLIRPITTKFHRARGIALGIALTGAGIAAFWVPRLVTHVTNDHGWREAYLVLAVIAIAAAPIVWFGFRRGVRIAPEPGEAPSSHGLDHARARRSGCYWLLSLIAFAMALGIAGVVVHMVPLFIDMGADPARAAQIASSVGIASVVGRLVVGYLLDRLPTVPVSICVLLLATLGILLLWGFGLQWGYAAAILLGLAAGAEIDLLAYLTVSYFGRHHYGAIYGWQYSVFALGYGFSPYFVGQLYDLMGGYGPALLASASLVVSAALGCLGLPKSGEIWLALQLRGATKVSIVQ
ncbi:MFS transporter [Haliea sp.]|jgi:MFS family permease|uniref:MFS transporter n=1 Tax=Haliea sp. TaxID=1932666 RepID=UPI000C457628|nr:MFS transporter [Haliea sp.]HCD56585.1 hypothetical protein [Halieaceae bacterium]MAD62138.1 hypothetical protein [Haliea sp.]MAY93859.1 hypothetical protein [Haliea sp.]MBK41618.1 hypothetical protein [Haliea sp.]MBP70880.1 hypothetical protein [Haliea sp.]|tara:strand:+ start:2603 stop:3856 length:1254 start_codon:yes stop_codon:yes gene_type:complete